MNNTNIHKMKLHDTTEIKTAPFIKPIEINEDDFITVRIIKVSGGWIYLFKESNSELKPTI